jgi:NADP-dependent 3-hydroxy acid dehydrogenase YdfG
LTNQPNKQIAVVTGGTSAIGQAICRKFGDMGYAVAIIGRSEAQRDELVQALSKADIDCRHWVCDVTSWQQVTATIGSIEDSFGAIKVLVNNAGGWIGGTIEAIDTSTFRQLLDATVVGTMHCCKAVLPGMRKRSSGFILNIGSTSGLPGSQDSASASAPKAAVRSFTQAFARELTGTGIRVAVLHPARVNKKLPADEAERANEEGKFLRVSPRQVAEVAAFMVEQPGNVLLSEIVMTPADVRF